MVFSLCAPSKDYDLLVQLGYEGITFAASGISEMEEGDFAALEGKVASGSLRAMSVNAFCNPDLILAGPGFDARKVRAYCEFLFARLNRLGIRHVGVGAPGSRIRPEGFPESEMRGHLLQALAEMCGAASKYGMKVLLEPLSSTNFIIHTSEALQVIEALGDGGIVYDIYHAYMTREDPREILGAGKTIEVVHVSGHTGGLRDYLQEENVSEYRPYFDALRKIGYDGEISVEPAVGSLLEEGERTLRLLRSMAGGTK